MKLSRINTLLIVAIVMVNGYVIAMPFLPVVVHAVETHSGKPEKMTKEIHAAAAAPTKPDTAQPNSVIVPAMVLDQPILEGRDTYAILDKGIWRWPSSSTPDKGGNTVLLGHRFTYGNPRGVFYFLDKLRVGDEIGLRWNGVMYVYKVDDSRVAPATEISILNNTQASQLTLFTCTPLWSPKDRLVVTATLINQSLVKP